jgi:hypothetical protein
MEAASTTPRPDAAGACRRGWRPSGAAIGFIGLCAVWLVPSRGYAQYVPGGFPAGVPGYDQELGVTVVSRLRPLYDQPGIRLGDFIVKPNLDESVGYDSNVLGLSGGAGSPVIETRPSVEIKSDWGRDAVGADFSLDDFRYPSASAQNRTDWTAAIGAGYTIDRSNLTFGYAHLQLHETPSTLAVQPSTTATPFTVDDLRVDYPFELGRLEVTPTFEISMWRYGNALLNGVTSNQDFRDTNIYVGGAALRYMVSGGTALVATVQGIASDYTHQVPGSPSLSSTSALALGGIDYQYDGVWRYQALVGLEARYFAAAQFKPRLAPIARATVIWTPTELTTVTASLLRAIEDPTQAGSSGYTYTMLGLRVDHEYARNILLSASAGADFVSYLQNGGTQTGYYASVGIAWLINREMRLSAQYSYATQNGFVGQGPVDGQSLAATQYPGATENVFVVSLHLGF